jgi:hypothetical protein
MSYRVECTSNSYRYCSNVIATDIAENVIATDIEAM